MTAAPTRPWWRTPPRESGLVALRGTARLVPQMADLELGMTNLDLRTLQPYLDPHLKLSLSSGAFAMQGRVLWQQAETNTPRLQFKGSLSVTNLVTTDQVAFEEFVKWNALDVGGVEFTMQPERLRLRSAAWDACCFSSGIAVMVADLAATHWLLNRRDAKL